MIIPEPFFVTLHELLLYEADQKYFWFSLLCAVRNSCSQLQRYFQKHYDTDNGLPKILSVVLPLIKEVFVG